MSLWDTLRRLLGMPLIRVERSVFYELQELAALEERPEEVVASDLLSMAISQRKTAADRLERWYSLTPRERDVAALACLNYTNAQIAARLSISITTVSTHVRSILNKFNLRSKVELQQFLSDWDFSAWGPE